MTHLQPPLKSCKAKMNSTNIYYTFKIHQITHLTWKAAKNYKLQFIVILKTCVLTQTEQFNLQWNLDLNYPGLDSLFMKFGLDESARKKPKDCYMFTC